jgi:hypothetical protein
MERNRRARFARGTGECARLHVSILTDDSFRSVPSLEIVRWKVCD